MAKAIIRHAHGVLNPRNDLSAQEARAALSYDKKTGALRWKFDRHKIKKGQIAATRGGTSHGFLVSYYGAVYIASRLIWLIVKGKWPENYIDHIDGNPFNNRWKNLRDVTASQNSINRDYETSQPYRGVFRITSGRSSGTRWRARITIRPGKRIELGCFGSAREAYEAYKEAALRYHGRYARLK